MRHSDDRERVAASESVLMIGQGSVSPMLSAARGAQVDRVSDRNGLKPAPATSASRHVTMPPSADAAPAHSSGLALCVGVTGALRVRVRVCVLVAVWECERVLVAERECVCVLVAERVRVCVLVADVVRVRV
jgi:hypothetical protein